MGTWALGDLGRGLRGLRARKRARPKSGDLGRASPRSEPGGAKEIWRHRLGEIPPEDPAAPIGRRSGGVN